MAGGFFKGLFGSSNSDTDATQEPSNAVDCVDVSGNAFGDTGTEHLSPKLKIRQDMLAEIRASMAEFENSVNAAKDLSSFSSTGLISAKAMLKDVELDLDSQIRIEGENLVLRNRISEAEKQVQSLQTELENQKAISDASQARLAEAHADLERTKDALVERKLEIEENELVIQQIQKAHGLLENENEQRKQALARLEQENLALNESMSSLQVELAAIRETATSAEKEANEWKRVSENTNARLEDSQRELQTLRAAHGKLQRTKIDLESQLDAMKGELSAEAKRVADQIRNKDAKIHALESRNEVLEANSRVANQRIEAIKSDNNDLQKANSILEKQADALKIKIENTRRSHELDREALYKSSDRIAELDLNLTATIAELNQANSERQSYATLVDDLTKKNAELSEKIIKLSAVEENHEQLVRAIREKNNLKDAKSGKSKQAEDNIVAMKASKSA